MVLPIVARLRHRGRGRGHDSHASGGRFARWCAAISAAAALAVFAHEARGRSGCFAVVASGVGSGGGGGVDDVLTSEELAFAASKLGVELRENTVGPWYEMELYSGEKQLGKTNGFAQPWGILHLETIEVRRFTGYWVAKPKPGMGRQGKQPASDEESPSEMKREADTSKVSRWFGLLLAMSIACWNRERSPFKCKEAHLLAIRDDEKQHRGLVRYYKGLGFRKLRDAEELTFQDQVTWGGEGTLMNVMADDFMAKWTPVVRQLAGLQPRAGTFRRTPEGAGAAGGVGTVATGAVAAVATGAASGDSGAGVATDAAGAADDSDSDSDDDGAL